MGALSPLEDELPTGVVSYEFSALLGFSPFRLRRRVTSGEPLPSLRGELVLGLGTGKCAEQ